MKPIKVEIQNELTGYSCGGRFDTLEEANEYVAKQEAKVSHPMGKPERYIKSDELSVELQARVLSIRQVEPEEAEAYEESLVKADYVVTIEDESNDSEYQLNECLRNRQREYCKIDHLLKEALVEKELGNTDKWDEYITLRNTIKTTYPKP